MLLREDERVGRRLKQKLAFIGELVYSKLCSFLVPSWQKEYHVRIGGRRTFTSDQIRSHTHTHTHTTHHCTWLLLFLFLFCFHLLLGLFAQP